jgi:hypothetical protein
VEQLLALLEHAPAVQVGAVQAREVLEPVDLAVKRDARVPPRHLLERQRHGQILVASDHGFGRKLEGARLAGAQPHQHPRLHQAAFGW